MPDQIPPHRHNGGPLNDDDARKLWNHIRALEALNEQAADIRLDIAARKDLAKSDGFDRNILDAIIKRRKIGEGETAQADTLVQLYEEALREQGVLPLEKTKAQPAPRRTIDQIAQELHGEDPPEGIRPSQEGRGDGYGPH